MAGKMVKAAFKAVGKTAGVKKPAAPRVAVNRKAVRKSRVRTRGY